MNDGVFVYNSGGNVNYTNWRVGEPDNTGDCVELLKVKKFALNTCIYFGSFWKSYVSEICVNQICINQGVGVYLW